MRARSQAYELLVQVRGPCSFLGPLVFCYLPFDWLALGRAGRLWSRGHPRPCVSSQGVAIKHLCSMFLSSVPTCVSTLFHGSLHLCPQIAHAMDDMDPGSGKRGKKGKGSNGRRAAAMIDSDDEDLAGVSDSDDDADEEEEAAGEGMEGVEGRGGAGASSSGQQLSGGLMNLFSMVMAGLAGQTPHMIR